MTLSIAESPRATASPGRHRLVRQPVSERGGASRRWWALGALCLSVLLVGIDNTIVNVALPTIGRDLDASTSDLQWVVDSYTLVFATLLLLAGHLGDRFGRRRILLTGLAIFALTSIAASFATSTTGLIGGRAAMGVGAALIFPATLALLVSLFPDRKERAAAIGVSPDGRAATVASDSRVPDIDSVWLKDRDVIRTAYEALDATVKGLRPRIEEVEKADLVTQDLFIEITATLEEQRWMWQAQNIGYESEA